MAESCCSEHLTGLSPHGSDGLVARLRKAGLGTDRYVSGAYDGGTWLGAAVTNCAGRRKKQRFSHCGQLQIQGWPACKTHTQRAKPVSPTPSYR